MRQTEIPQWRLAIPATLISIVIFAQLIALGANTSLLMLAAAAANQYAALIALWVLPPSRASWRATRPVWPPLGLALGWAGLLAMLFMPAADPAQRAAYIGQFAVLIGLAGLGIGGMALGARPRGASMAITMLLAGGLAWMLVGLAIGFDQTTIWGLSKAQQRNRYSATLLNANVAGCVFSVLAILAATMFTRERARWAARYWVGVDWKRLALYLTVLTLALASVALTRSRTAMVLTLAGLALPVLIDLARSTGQRGASALGLAILAVPTLAILLSLGDGTMSRFGLASSDISSRAMAIRFFFGLSLEHPWIGFGPGSFEAVKAGHLDPRLAPYIWDFGAAHNAAIHAALELGWPFVAFAALVVASWSWCLAHGWREGYERRLLVGLALGVSAILIPAMIDIALNVPAVAALAAYLGGLALGISGNPGRAAQRPAGRARAAPR